MSEDMGCYRELNRQLQGLQARIKSLEEQAAALEETQLTDIAQTAAALAAAVSQIPQALPTYIANQLILKIASAVLGEAIGQVPGMGSAGEFLANIGDMAEMVKSIIMELMTSPILGAEFWSQFQLELMIPRLTIPPFLMAVMDAALSAAQAALDAAQAALALDPLNAELQAAVQAALAFRDSINSSATSLNNVAKCYSSSALFNALPGGV